MMETIDKWPYKEFAHESTTRLSIAKFPKAQKQKSHIFIHILIDFNSVATKFFLHFISIQRLLVTQIHYHFMHNGFFLLLPLHGVLYRVCSVYQNTVYGRCTCMYKCQFSFAERCTLISLFILLGRSFGFWFMFSTRYILQNKKKLCLLFESKKRAKEREKKYAEPTTVLVSAVTKAIIIIF